MRLAGENVHVVCEHPHAFDMSLSVLVESCNIITHYAGLRKAFLFEDLSDQILGSWECQEKEMTPILVYPFGDNMLIGRTGWTLTFCRSSRFDSM